MDCLHLERVSSQVREAGLYMKNCQPGIHNSSDTCTNMYTSPTVHGIDKRMDLKATDVQGNVHPPDKYICVP